MRVERLFALAACTLLWSAAAYADVVKVTQTLDHTYDEANGWAFWDPGVIVDHTPFCRHAWEDWGWTHDLTDRVPGDVNSIQSATLSIVAWQVDETLGEVDAIHVNNLRIGALQGPGNGVPVPPLPAEMYQVEGQPYNAFADWSVTDFTLPATIAKELLRDGKLDVFMNIDESFEGHRVTIASSTLDVNYVVTRSVSEPNVTVHRFWSPVLSSHFYTVSESEKDYLIANYPAVWTYEGIAYRAFGDALDSFLRPVYRFWSASLGSHFYTISEDEKNYLEANYRIIWTYEGIAWYAYPEGLQPAEALPVYRFWSGSLGRHFYTLSEPEKQNLIDTWSAVWTYEGMAWYAYPPGEVKTHTWPNTF